MSDQPEEDGKRVKADMYFVYVWADVILQSYAYNSAFVPAISRSSTSKIRVAPEKKTGEPRGKKYVSILFYF